MSLILGTLSLVIMICGNMPFNKETVAAKVHEHNNDIFLSKSNIAMIMFLNKYKNWTYCSYISSVFHVIRLWSGMQCCLPLNFILFPTLHICQETSRFSGIYIDISHLLFAIAHICTVFGCVYGSCMDTFYPLGENYEKALIPWLWGCERTLKCILF